MLHYLVSGLLLALLVGYLKVWPNQEPVNVAIHSHQIRGRRFSQEDFMLVAQELGPQKEFTLLGVFDGHGGDSVSKELPALFEQKVSHKLATMSATCPPLDLTSLMLSSVFEEITAYFKNEWVAKETGSTAVVALIQSNGTVAHKVWFANLGDSRALLFNAKTKKLDFATEDHKPGAPNEESRIRALGGFVTNDGVPRVQGVLAVSRAVGDTNYHPYVGSEPTISGPFDIAADSVILLASDGLFDVFTNQAVIDFWHQTNQSLTTTLNSLVLTAYAKDSLDNISAVAALPLVLARKPSPDVC